MHVVPAPPCRRSIPLFRVIAATQRRPCAAACACTALLMPLLTTGCMVAGRGDLPMGEWAGRGTFIYEEWEGGGPGARAKFDGSPASQPGGASITRDYDTTLSIQPGKLGDEDVIWMKIRSSRGELPNLEEQTYLVAALVAGKRVGDNGRLYTARAMEINPKDEIEPPTAADDAPPYVATCITRGDTTTFQIGYTENFVDVIRFQGWSVEKCGAFFDEKKGLVHWSEKLARKR